MRRVSTIVVVIMACACNTVSPQRGTESAIHESANTLDSEAEFRAWFSYYYLSPQPNRVPAAIHFMAKHDYLQDFPDIALVFLGILFARHEERVEGWLDQLGSLSPAHWDIILSALWASGSENGRHLAQKHLHRGVVERANAFQGLEQQKITSVLKFIPVEQPQHVNLLWAGFSATGDADYIKRIISLVSDYESEGTSLRSQIAEVAIMTLANNALQHELVARVCIDQQQNHPHPKVRVLLEAMLSALASATSSQ